MARNKETLVVLLDASVIMRPHLHVALQSVASLLHRKLMFNKADEVGLVFFGVADTKNDLNKELGGYENVVVSRPIAIVDEDLSKCLEDVPEGTVASDFLDAIVVGIDMIVKKLAQGKKGNIRLSLITTTENSIRDPDTGTVEEQVDNIAKQMSEQGIKLEATIVRIGQQTPFLDSKTQQKNEALLRRFESQAQAEVSIVETSMSLLGAMKPRNVTPTTLYRGDLELTPSMTVKVWVYKKTAQEKFLTLKKFSDNAPASDVHATREVKMDTDYKSVDNPDISVPPEQRTKAYRYGRNYVPISTELMETLKFKTEKGLKLIGFVPVSAMPRHYYMKEANMFVPEPGHTKSILAVSALARAMDATHQVALVRCVWRQGQNNVVLGVLTPYVATQLNRADGFYFNVIPFADDIREYPFTSFNTLPEALQPSEVQQKAADNLVHMLDLAPAENRERLQPDGTMNPILQRYYNFLHARALNSEADVPPIDEALHSIVEPDPELLSENSFAIQQLCTQFPLTPNLQKEKGRKRFWRERVKDGEVPLEIKDEAAMDVGPISFSSLVSKQVEEVGITNPVQDFEVLLARRDSSEWVPKALQGMKKIIDDLLDSAYSGNTYEKALSCLCALRSGCVVQQEPLEFNIFLRKLATKCQGKRLNDFWERVVREMITLISRDEAPDSDVGSEEAAAFLTSQREALQEEPQDEIDEMELLLGEAI